MSWLTDRLSSWTQSHQPPPPLSAEAAAFAATQQQPNTPTDAQGRVIAPATPNTPAPTPSTPGKPEAPPATEPFPTPKDAMERRANELWRIEQERTRIQKTIDHPPTLSSGRVDQAALDDAYKALEVQNNAYRATLTAIEVEQARLDAAAKEQATAKDKPTEGQTRDVQSTYNGRAGTYQEVYKNGVWSFVQGSAKFLPGDVGGQQPTNKTAFTDQQGNYWSFDPQSGSATKINGVPGAPAKIVPLGDGTTWLQGPDGNLTTKLTEAKPTTNIVEGTMVMTDSMTGKEIARIDLMTPEGRARAEQLANLSVEQAQQGLQPKFASAQAQYTQEAQRRQALARQELSRLTKLQQEGQISPDQAEAQFDTWMKVNVEGPLAGYKQAADQERQIQEQQNQDRTTAEQNRVDTLNRQRDQMAYEAGEAGRTQAIDLGSRTRAPEFIAGLGQAANAMATGQKFAGWAPGAFDPANYKKVLPDINGMADAAVQRLLGRISPAVAQNVNVPLAGPPTGPDLQSLMSQVRYAGPVAGAPGMPPPAPPNPGLPNPYGTP